MMMSKIPYITTDQMREVDRLMIEHFRIGLGQMMENAGRNLAELARKDFFAGNTQGKKVLILAGTGGNGGGGLVAARHLHNRGADVTVILATSKYSLAKIPRRQFDILEEIGIKILISPNTADFTAFDLVIDALLGYSLRGNPEDEHASLIIATNSHNIPVLSLDTPSGLDTTTGEVFDPCIKADVTMTLALPKTGFQTKTAKANIGKLYLADIGVPPELYKMMELEVPKGLFSDGYIIKV